MDVISTNKNNKKRARLFFALLVLYTYSCVFRGLPEFVGRIVQMSIVIILLFMAVFVLPDTRNILKIKISVFLFSFLVLFYKIIGYSSSGLGVMLMQISYFAAIFATIYCVERIGIKHVLLLFYVLVGIVSIALFQDVVLNRTYNYEMLLSNFDEMEEMGSYIGWTAFSTMILFLYCISLLIFLNNPRKSVKIFYAIIMVLSLYYLFFCSMRGTIVVLLLLATALMLYSKYSRKNTFFRIMGIVIIVLLVMVWLFAPDILLNAMVNYSPNERLAQRAYDIQQSYEFGLSENSFSGRFGLEMISIRTWLRDPLTFLFGIGDHRISDYGVQGFAMTGIGGHSEIIDSLARFGVVGFSIISVAFYYISSYIVNLFYDKIVKKQVRIIIVIFLLAALTKAVLFHIIGIVFLLLFPLSSFVINKQNQLS